ALPICWNARSPDEQKRILAEQEDIFATVLDAMDEGPGGARVQAAIARLHENVNMFWDCGDEAFRGLGDLYVTDPRFRATFARMDERMPEVLQQAMCLYCDRRPAAESRPGEGDVAHRSLRCATSCTCSMPAD